MVSGQITLQNRPLNLRPTVAVNVAVYWAGFSKVVYVKFNSVKYILNDSMTLK